MVNWSKHFLDIRVHVGQLYFIRRIQTCWLLVICPPKSAYGIFQILIMDMNHGNMKLMAQILIPKYLFLWLFIPLIMFSWLVSDAWSVWIAGKTFISAVQNELRIWDWSQKDPLRPNIPTAPFVTIKTNSEREKISYVRKRFRFFLSFWWF